ncbi:GNAT family N-acetyltransferase [Cedecea davisae]|uniref:GNAT family N-acetyltransferase n=1 Tax=Cedecea davisae TaxID=158484 RepID=A0ABS6DIN5_9ENTR|nr:GNAT family N-acetyltransferase [Cedecea davisae]MBU4682930.1 GNAT family N-acetyltransferase [Cedecea davisae]MBU4687971.1 GNAT family N-acetyltransferase [Cedecea davisae]
MELTTERLILRPFKLIDAPELQCLAGDPELAKWTRCFNSSFTLEQSVDWINRTVQQEELNENITLSVHLKHDDTLIGAVSLMKKDMHQAELGYWLGVPFWHNGYCREAVSELIRFAFIKQKITRLFARCEKDNTASQKVMLYCGMHPISEQYSVIMFKKREVEIATYEKII